MKNWRVAGMLNPPRGKRNARRGGGGGGGWEGRHLLRRLVSKTGKKKKSEIEKKEKGDTPFTTVYIHVYTTKTKYAPAVRSKISSKLIFASCVCDTPIASTYWVCVLIKDIGRRLPLELQCSLYQGQQGDVIQSVCITPGLQIFGSHHPVRYTPGG